MTSTSLLYNWLPIIMCKGKYSANDPYLFSVHCFIYTGSNPHNIVPDTLSRTPLGQDMNGLTNNGVLYRGQFMHGISVYSVVTLYVHAQQGVE